MYQMVLVGVHPPFPVRPIPDVNIIIMGHIVLQGEKVAAALIDAQEKAVLCTARVAITVFVDQIASRNVTTRQIARKT